MKKLIFVSLIAASLVLTSAQAFAYPAKPANFRDATWLAKEENMTSDFKKPKGGGMPIGSVIAWPYEKMPEDEGWVECNGQWPAEICKGTDCKEYTDLYGAKIPDYRGVFLRGAGTNGYHYRMRSPGPAGYIDRGTNYNHQHYAGHPITIATGGHHAGDSVTVLAPWDSLGLTAIPIWEDTNSFSPNSIGGKRSVHDSAVPMNIVVKYLIKVR